MAVVADIGDLAIDPLIDAREQLLLVQPGRSVRPAQLRLHQRRGRGAANMVPARIEARPLDWDSARAEFGGRGGFGTQSGRASGRARVCKYGSITGVAE